MLNIFFMLYQQRPPTRTLQNSRLRFPLFEITPSLLVKMSEISKPYTALLLGTVNSSTLSHQLHVDSLCEAHLEQEKLAAMNHATASIRGNIKSITFKNVPT